MAVQTSLQPTISGTLTPFVPVRESLQSLLGRDYTDAVVSTRGHWLGSEAAVEAAACAAREVDFFPIATQQRLAGMLGEVGRIVSVPAGALSAGATTNRFVAATNTKMAPVGSLGYYRIGQDGRVYLITKSEHYHASLGHGFAGYRLIDHARSLGIPNATHNNTRGHITRLAEEELVLAAGGLARSSPDAASLLSGTSGGIDRVLNLETGSLAMEAAIKIALSRFYRSQVDAVDPVLAGKKPVFVVLGDESGGIVPNYHGTTILAQTMRGMWSDLRDAIAESGALRTVAVPFNNIPALQEAFARHHAGDERIALFMHELVLMNYAGYRIEPAFIEEAYRLCARHEVPTVVDEIQTGVWSPQMFLFREYALNPTMVAIGKGFPGGEFPASRLLLRGSVDLLPQFGALVTNGQEELASLAYVVTMRWVSANAEAIERVGRYYEQRLDEVVSRHPTLMAGWSGRRHLAGIRFTAVDAAKRFATALNAMGIDISVQTYKSTCPPAALTKLPLIAGTELVDVLIDRMDRAANSL